MKSLASHHRLLLQSPTDIFSVRRLREITNMQCNRCPLRGKSSICSNQLAEISFLDGWSSLWIGEVLCLNNNNNNILYGFQILWFYNSMNYCKYHLLFKRKVTVLQRLFLALCCDFEEKQSVLWNELLFSHNIIMCVNYICATFSIMFILCLNMDKNFHSYYFALIPIRCLFKIATYL